jgi:putative phosphoesterase
VIEIAVISDTHLPRGARRLPDDCVERLREADLILHAGDFTSSTTLAEIETLGTPLAAVHGNVDDEGVRRALPATRILNVGDVRIAMTHDAGPAQGRLARLRDRFPDADAAVFGHSHMPLHEEADGFQIFNPGSPTERRRAPAHTMGIARVEGRRLTFELVTVG